MTIELLHTIVPARNKSVSAKYLAMIFCLSVDERASEYFAPVRVNEGSRSISTTRSTVVRPITTRLR